MNKDIYYLTFNNHFVFIPDKERVSFANSVHNATMMDYATAIVLRKEICKKFNKHEENFEIKKHEGGIL